MLMTSWEENMVLFSERMFAVLQDKNIHLYITIYKYMYYYYILLNVLIYLYSNILYYVCAYTCTHPHAPTCIY